MINNSCGIEFKCIAINIKECHHSRPVTPAYNKDCLDVCQFLNKDRRCSCFAANKDATLYKKHVFETWPFALFIAYEERTQKENKCNTQQNRNSNRATR